MSAKKDMRRPDLAVPYVEPTIPDSDIDIQGTLASTLPMAAIFTRNRAFGWASVVLAIQSWLAETPESAKKSATPAYFTIGLSLLSLMTGYMALIMPSKTSQGGISSLFSGTGTEAAAPKP